MDESMNYTRRGIFDFSLFVDFSVETQVSL